MTSHIPERLIIFLTNLTVKLINLLATYRCQDWCNHASPQLWQSPLTVFPPPAALPPPLVLVSVVPASAMLAVQLLPSQGIYATNSASDDIAIVFLYGVAQAMAMKAQASNTAFDLPSLNPLQLWHPCEFLQCLSWLLGQANVAESY